MLRGLHRFEEKFAALTLIWLAIREIMDGGIPDGEDWPQQQ
jgi:hypothetical protein